MVLWSKPLYTNSQSTPSPLQLTLCLGLGSCTEFSSLSAPIRVQVKLTLHVFCSGDKGMSIKRYNRIATPKNSIFPSDRRRNTLCNESLWHYHKRHFSGLQLSIPRYLFAEVVTSKLYVVFSALPLVGKLICSPREFDYQMLVYAWCSIKTKKTLRIPVLHVTCCVASFSSTL